MQEVLAAFEIDQAVKLMEFDDESTLNYSHVGGLIEAATSPSLFIYHRDGAQALTLTSSRAVVIGRDITADVPIRDRTLSRRHSRFELFNDEIWVHDLKSTNGTFVNGTRITRSRIQPGDEVCLGAVTVMVHGPGTKRGQGMESHDQFMALLENERARAKLFGRFFALVVVRSAVGPKGHVSQWWHRVDQYLRKPVDRIGLYAADTLEILLPEAGYDEAMRLAKAIAAGGERDSELPLLCGISLYPGDGAYVEELLEGCYRAVLRASLEEPIQLASSRDRTFDGDEETAAITLGGRLLVASKAMREILDTVQILSRSMVPVLIFGETGAGKEVIARAIHDGSNRSNKPLKTINCGAIPEQLIESVLFGHERGAFTGAERQTQGVFEAANGGSVLLDEIGELSLSAQVALLRVLDTKLVSRVGSNKEFEVDVRIMAATHRNLEEMCERQQFRWDLFYRLNTMTLKIPPLRERVEDVLPLAKLFLQEAAQRRGLGAFRLHPLVLSCLQAYSWPGNIRELRNVIDRAVILAQGDVITPEDLSERIWNETMIVKEEDNTYQDEVITSVRSYSTRMPSEGVDAVDPGDTLPHMPAVSPGSTGAGTIHDFKWRVRRYEAELIRKELQAGGGDRSVAAEKLGLSVRALTHKRNAYGMGGAPPYSLPPAPVQDQRLWSGLGGSPSSTFKDRVQQFESALIRQALESSDWNKSSAARLLKMPLRTLMFKVKAYRLKRS